MYETNSMLCIRRRAKFVEALLWSTVDSVPPHETQEPNGCTSPCFQHLELPKNDI